MKPEIRFHIRETDQRTPVWIGPGKVALLEAIGETGSITSSAKKLGMSYRRAWLLGRALHTRERRGVELLWRRVAA